MYTLYCRHISECPHADNKFWRGCSKRAGCEHQGQCKCRIWLAITDNGEDRRESLKTRSWEAAERLKTKMERGEAKAAVMTVQEAKTAYLTDCAARNLSKNTQNKLKLILGELDKQFGRRPINAVTFHDLVTFRATWTGPSGHTT